MSGLGRQGSAGAAEPAREPQGQGSGRDGVLRAMIEEMRLRQWTKNGVVLAGIVFSLQAGHLEQILRAGVAFVSFCLLSSAGYVFNDLRDLENDRFHPRKRERPLASGRLSLGAARGLMAALVVLGLGAAAYLGGRFAVVAGAYLTLSVAYSLLLKRIVLLDVMGIAFMFLLRATAGVDALRPRPALSPWLLVCTLFLALFLAVVKRRHERISLSEDAETHRSILAEYPPELLDQLVPVVTGSTIIAYALYTISPTGAHLVPSGKMVYTIPFVVYGIFRYLYLVYRQGKGGAPSEILLTDGPLLLNVLLWGLVIFLILYFG
jgi:4-hydroxybenzoate polyprenyltransferase